MVIEVVIQLTASRVCFIIINTYYYYYYNQVQPLRINYLARQFLHRLEPQAYKFYHNINNPYDTVYINSIVLLYN